MLLSKAAVESAISIAKCILAIARNSRTRCTCTYFEAGLDVVEAVAMECGAPDLDQVPEPKVLEMLAVLETWLKHCTE